MEGDYIFGGVTNSTSVAGLVKLDPELVALDDGLFEVALVKYPATLADLNALVSQAVSKNYKGEMLSITKARRVRFTFPDPVPFTRDGEPGGVHSDVTIENARAAVRIVV
ncbi:MAG: diacylglycerol/lipid kinase family protein [Lachnospiraceae bacterium]